LSTYRVEILPAVERQLRWIDSGPRKRIDAAILSLAADPRPHGCRKLSGSDEYRIRVGDYRILYEIADAVLRVLVVKVGHRRDVYR
jgi:mRNA interferase RelE/StbE